MKLLGPCTTTTKPELLSLRAIMTEPTATTYPPPLLTATRESLHSKKKTLLLPLCCSVTSDSLQTQPARLLCPWDSPDKNTGVDGHALLQGIFPAQRLNMHHLCLLAWADGFFTTSTTWEAQQRPSAATNK